jgi:TolA-binding protein
MPPNDLPDQDAGAREKKVPDGAESSAETARGISAWIKTHRLKAVLAMSGIAALLIVAATAAFMYFKRPSGPRPEDLVKVDQILEALDRREFAEVQSLAKRAEEQRAMQPEELGGPAFALGAKAAYEAEHSTGKDRDKLFLLASRYLEEANNRGFPPGRDAEGLYLLGESLYESGQIQSSRPVLIAALKAGPKYSAEIHALLAGVYLNDVPPKLDQALGQNTLLLAEENLSEAKRQDALVVRSQILLGLGKIEECNAVLDKIPAGAKIPSAAVQRGRVLMHNAEALIKNVAASDEDRQKARDEFQEAIQMLRVAQREDTVKGKAAGQAMYLTGVCLLESGDSRAALEQFARTHNAFVGTPEGLAAGFQAAELCRQQGRDVDALADYRRVLTAISEPTKYINPWITLEQIRAGVLAAYQYYLGAQKFEFALQLTRSMQPLFSADQALLLQAETYGLWGQALFNQADKGPRNKADTVRHLGREQFRRAGACYAKLASMLPANKTFTDQLWNSASAFMQGQDYTSAARIFQDYLKNEAERRRPQALTQVGEALLATGQTEKALEMLKECIDLYPRDAAASRARLMAARAYAEKENWREAENMLTDNLRSDFLTPESKEWRDSLLSLGELLAERDRMADAALRLEEYCKRYPDLPDAVEARYMAANCYYGLAIEIRDKLKNNTLTTQSAALQAKQVQDLYGKALAQYTEAREALAKVRDTGELSPQDKAILRNCCFAVGNVLSAMGDYDAAIKAYSTAVVRYQNCPEVLEAYVQIAEAYRNLNKPQEAKNTLEQAKFALARMKPDAAFETNTNYSRKGWAQRLDLLSTM